MTADFTGAPDLQAQLPDVPGLALIDMGSIRMGVGKCEKARAAVEASHDEDGVLQEGVAVLQARFGHDERKAVLQVFKEIKPSLASRPELPWQALALATVAEPKDTDQAREALLKLSRLWGDSVYTIYRTRPDVGTLSRPLWPLVSK